jgi:hypothetical protein
MVQDMLPSRACFKIMRKEMLCSSFSLQGKNKNTLNTSAVRQNIFLLMALQGIEKNST